MPVPYREKSTAAIPIGDGAKIILAVPRVSDSGTALAVGLPGPGAARRRGCKSRAASRRRLRAYPKKCGTGLQPVCFTGWKPVPGVNGIGSKMASDGEFRDPAADPSVRPGHFASPPRRTPSGVRRGGLPTGCQQAGFARPVRNVNGYGAFRVCVASAPRGGRSWRKRFRQPTAGTGAGRYARPAIHQDGKRSSGYVTSGSEPASNVSPAGTSTAARAGERRTADRSATGYPRRRSPPVATRRRVAC